MASGDSDGHYDAIADELERYKLRRIQGYTSITVLIIYWEDNDLNISGEIQALEEVFEKTCNYRVERYEIPSARAQAMLNEAISSFLLQHGTSDNLVVVYYGGHGGPPKNGSTECEWAATIDSAGATLDWAASQVQLLTAECDVVIILDCCYAGSAVRGGTRQYVEILLATDKDHMTPTGAGTWPSFTKVFTEKLKQTIDLKQEANLRYLHSQMIPSSIGLRRQPILVSGRHSAGNIVLRKCAHRASSPGSSIIQKDSSSRFEGERLFLEVHTHRPMRSTALEAIIRWLTKDSPSSIADIQIAKRTVSNASSSQTVGALILQEADDDTRGRPSISEGTRNELKELLDHLEKISKAPSPQDLTDEEAIKLVGVLRERSHSLATLIEDLVAGLQQPQLRNLLDQAAVDNAELRARIKMRLRLLDLHNPVQGSSPIINFTEEAQKEQQFRSGTLHGQTVLVQYRYYEELDDEEHNKLSNRMARMSALFSEAKPASFRTLNGVGYVHERLYGPRFGFIYRRPQDHLIGSFDTLAELIMSCAYVPLDARIRISRALCEAMLQLHSIGWYHKAIKSSNVLLFGKETGAIRINDYDLEAPYLVGFDCSRPMDAETRQSVDYTFNIYRHPARWGDPVKFKSHHDLYALGILLLEIGCWRLLPRLDSKQRGFEYMKNPELLRDYLLSKALERLAHYSGNSYASAVRVCLERRSWENMEEWQLQRVIREEVLAALRVAD